MKTISRLFEGIGAIEVPDLLYVMLVFFTSIVLLREVEPLVELSVEEPVVQQNTVVDHMHELLPIPAELMGSDQAPVE